MELPGFIKNKYTVSVLILLGLLGTDIVLHQGMSRVILPDSFTDKVKPYTNAPVANHITINQKNWTRGVNQVEWMDRIPPDRGGIEFDVYMDTAIGRLLVYHDSDRISRLQADSLLAARLKKGISGGIWLDLKNLSKNNLSQTLNEVQRLQNIYGMKEEMIIESSSPALLHSFTQSGYYTSYYVPYFNPYQLSEDSLVQHLQTIRQELEKYPCSSLSGYYFQ